MKNITILLLAVFTISCAAQDNIKVKGNREVTTEITKIEPFETLNIEGDYAIEIVLGVEPQIEITTDSNLHQYIEANVIGGNLVINTTARIRKSKEMKFRVVYTDILKNISVADDAELSSVTELNFQNLELNIEDDAEVFMTATVQDLVLNAQRSTKSELNLKGDKAVISMRGNANIEALLSYGDLKLDMQDRTDAKIEGDIRDGKLFLKNKAQIVGKNLAFSNLNLVIKDNATSSIMVKSDLDMEAMGDAKVEIYGSPKIDLRKFTGDAVMMKK